MENSPIKRILSILSLRRLDKMKTRMQMSVPGPGQGGSLMQAADSLGGAPSKSQSQTGLPNTSHGNL